MSGHDFKATIRNHFAEPEADHRVKNAQAIAFFHRLQAKGVPVKITRH